MTATEEFERLEHIFLNHRIKGMYTNNDIIIVDGSFHLHRFYNGIPKAARLSDGTEVNAVYGFIAFIRRIHSWNNEALIVVVFDSENGIKAKKESNPEYKSQRHQSTTTIYSQLEIIKNILEFIGIKYIEDNDHEGDDVICSIAKYSKQLFRNVFIASHDKDFICIIDDKTMMIKELKGNIKVVKYDSVVKDFGIKPDQYLLLLSITGDNSDNIHGINGIGRKTAAKIINAATTPEEMFKNPIFDKYADKIYKHKQLIMQNYDFLKMNDDIFVDHSNLIFYEIEKENLKIKTNQILNKLGYGKSIRKTNQPDLVKSR